MSPYESQEEPAGAKSSSVMPAPGGRTVGSALARWRAVAALSAVLAVGGGLGWLASIRATPPALKQSLVTLDGAVEVYERSDKEYLLIVFESAGALDPSRGVITCLGSGAEFVLPRGATVARLYKSGTVSVVDDSVPQSVGMALVTTRPRPGETLEAWARRLPRVRSQLDATPAVRRLLLGR